MFVRTCSTCSKCGVLSGTLEFLYLWRRETIKIFPYFTYEFLQGLNFVAGILLLVMQEESQATDLLVHMVRQRQNYYGSDMLGLRVDMTVLQKILRLVSITGRQCFWMSWRGGREQHQFKVFVSGKHDNLTDPKPGSTSEGSSQNSVGFKV